MRRKRYLFRLTCDTIGNMAQATGTITELRMEAGGLSGRISCPPGLRPAPGQYLVASSIDYCEPLPVVLFPVGVEQDELRLAPPLPVNWTTGMSLALRGPLGKGFRMPLSARRVALAGLDGSVTRLLPLASAALDQQASVAVYASRVSTNLPAEVEVLPLEMLPEAPAWADFLALETDISVLPRAREQLGLNPFQRLACQAQILVHTPMPCSGMADCGVCAVRTSSGWALACSDGPVFDFHLIDWG